MSYADDVFKNVCEDIITNGESTEGQDVRAIWPDTKKKAYTIKKFGVVNRYDLRKEFPVLTLRPTALKSAMDEILWIWQKKSNNTNDLNSHIWDQWADESGSIGKAYGYQIGKRYLHHTISKMDKDNQSNVIEELKEYPSAYIQFNSFGDEADIYLDQTDGVIWDLKHNPFSRRIMTNIYNFKDLHEMNLYPCAYSMTFNCTTDKETGKLVLNGILNQRSQDTLTAMSWNEAQYSLLIMMIAQVCDMIPGEFIHVISDCHIYDRHIPIIKELISRESFPAPKISLNPEIKNFYDFKVSDLRVENYKHGNQVKIPVAI